MSARMFVCGDIHGCLDELLASLDGHGFDRSTDHLYALGDLVDRGPKSAEVLELLNEPWFSSIMGNHEVLMMDAFRGNEQMHMINGGNWFAWLDDNTRARFAALVRDLPIALAVTTPTGRRIGLVHADMPGDDWDAFFNGPHDRDVQDYALWARTRVKDAKAGRNVSVIRNIDHVFFGHTPVKQPLRVANFSFIDTGCFSTGRITVDELH